jgi:hypothetical protein
MVSFIAGGCPDSVLLPQPEIFMSGGGVFQTTAEEGEAGTALDADHAYADRGFADSRPLRIARE